MAGFVWQGIKTMSDEEKSEVFKFLETIPILDVRELAVQNRACTLSAWSSRHHADVHRVMRNTFLVMDGVRFILSELCVCRCRGT
jgi:hypothetical protein